MSTLIPTTWDDVELWLTANTSPFSGAPVRIIKPSQSAPYKCVVIRGDLQQRVTAVSRYARIGVQGWAVTAAGESDLSAARDLAADYGAHLEALLNSPATQGPFLSAEVDSGPVRVKDSETKLEYSYLTILAEVAAA